MNDGLAGCDKGDVFAIAKLNGFADLKFQIWIMHRVQRRFAEADVDGSRARRGGADGVTGLDVVGGDDDVDVVDRPQRRQVVQ